MLNITQPAPSRHIAGLKLLQHQAAILSGRWSG
jgi:hypothetical protein